MEGYCGMLINITEDLRRTRRPFKLNNNQVAGLVRKINNKAGVSQRCLAKHYNVS